MVCGRCGVANDAGRKFCGECGERLVATCPSCAAPNAPTAKFCGECGTGLGQPITEQAAVHAGNPRLPLAPAQPSAERRLVSILFADLVGFTPFAEERDPEEVRETLTRYFDLATDVITRYGGTVEKFIGDAVMAVWGAPTAHEDDAERAVRAGLELVDAVRTLGPTIQARAGVLTGEAAVSLGAVNQGMVAGDLVNTAARLQSVAAPGTVLAGEETVRAADRAIAFEPAGAQSLKGKAAPVAAWRALRVVAERGGRNRSEALEAPFVGRDDELRLLKDWFHAAGRDRRLRTVSITGQGGIGKSRLAWEFEKYLDGLVEPVFWHHGRSPSIGGALPFWALGEMVRGRFGLAETDDDATVRARITADLPRWVPDAEERRWIEPALLALVGAEGETRPGHEQLFGAWRTLLERIALQGTVVLVFEDLHWADDGLLAFVDHLAEWSRSAPILLVSLARPELLDRRTDWGAGRRHFVNLPLEPLSDAAMHELLAGLVPGLPEAAADAVVSRADGIPLYAVETVRMLVAEGRLAAQEDGTYRPTGDLSTLAVPATLQSLIAARLDALDPADRSLLQAASVVGQSFTLPALTSVLGDATGLEARLASLARRELLVHDRDPRSPERGQYAFVQALLREVAYGTLARADRRRLHLAAARHFETLGDEAAPGALATQYLAAWTASAGGPEADALAGQARIALRSAADRAAGLGSMDQAVALLRQALDVTTDDDERVAILERAGDLATAAGQLEAAEELLLAAEALFEVRDDRSGQARVIARRANVLSGNNRREAGLALTTEAAERFADLGDDPGLVHLLAQHSRFLFLGDDQAGAVVVADRTLPMAERLDLLPIVAELLITRGSALASDGREYEGIAVLEGGLKLAVAHGLTTTELRARINLSGLLSVHDPRAAFETATVGAELAMRLGLKSYVPSLVGNAATNALETGDWDLALDQLHRALETASVSEGARIQLEFYVAQFGIQRGDDVAAPVARIDDYLSRRIDAGDRSLTSSRHYLAAAADHAAGRYADACDHLLAAAPDDGFNAAGTYAWAIDIAGMLRDERRLRLATDGLRATGSHAPLSRMGLQVGEAALHALTGRGRDALVGFREALLAATALGSVWARGQACLVMGTVLDVREPEVRRALLDARELFGRVGARPWVERADALLGEAGGSRVPEPGPRTAPPAWAAAT